jgi:hypothetical protein
MPSWPYDDSQTELVSRLAFSRWNIGLTLEEAARGERRLSYGLTEALG